MGRPSLCRPKNFQYKRGVQSRSATRALLARHDSGSLFAERGNVGVNCVGADRAMNLSFMHQSFWSLQYGFHTFSTSLIQTQRQEQRLCQISVFFEVQRKICNGIFRAR